MRKLCCAGCMLTLTFEFLPVQSVSQHKVADFSLHDAVSSWLLLAPMSVVLAEDDVAFVQSVRSESFSMRRH